MTFNTGTTAGLAHDSNTDDGYTSDEADISDQVYGDGLAFNSAITQTTAWFAQVQPDIVVFQEMFYSGECELIPQQFHPGFACEGWMVGDPSVVNVVLGPDYQVACHLGKNDKCAAVHKDLGSFAGCDEDLCLDGLDGAQVQDCGGGSRIGRGTIELVGGGSLTVVNVHGTSGILPADQDCRIKQIEQVFEDLDGEPAANGARNLIMGDFNTDPAKAIIDLSAFKWNDYVGDGKDFHFITDLGDGAIPTYNGLNIDHVVSDVFDGTCEHPGATPGVDPVLDFIYFDHKPAVCTIVEQTP